MRRCPEIRIFVPNPANLTLADPIHGLQVFSERRLPSLFGRPTIQNQL